MGVAPDLLRDLLCPVDRGSIREDGERLICATCGRRYPVRDGIPVMLEHEAERPAR
ncbi:MAG TPA: Trm112 family protein [Candidatus Limnocylindria bacterium]|nr:Trm112 family protein [Candidatus Limnocylindria bacterium]